jgi:hypothetical protein
MGNIAPTTLSGQMVETGFVEAVGFDMLDNENVI